MIQYLVRADQLFDVDGRSEEDVFVEFWDSETDVRNLTEVLGRYECVCRLTAEGLVQLFQHAKDHGIFMAVIAVEGVGFDRFRIRLEDDMDTLREFIAKENL